AHSAAAAVEMFDALYEQIRALPENLTGEILEPGVLRTMSRPGKAHRRAARVCLHELGDHDANVGGSGWWIEVFETIDGRPALTAIAMDDDRAALPPFGGEFAARSLWLTGVEEE
ncbi:MAG TPA: hypothetical protein VLS89_09135, partial [Candidatus Nanopelagicales bacterium]|nr:hypothetical protein [Candidatus Nanopelagicales bacterium]